MLHKYVLNKLYDVHLVYNGINPGADFVEYKVELPVGPTERILEEGKYSEADLELVPMPEKQPKPSQPKPQLSPASTKIEGLRLWNEMSKGAKKYLSAVFDNIESDIRKKSISKEAAASLNASLKQRGYMAKGRGPGADKYNAMMQGYKLSKELKEFNDLEREELESKLSEKYGEETAKTLMDYHYSVLTPEELEAEEKRRAKEEQKREKEEAEQAKRNKATQKIVDSIRSKIKEFIKIPKNERMEYAEKLKNEKPEKYKELLTALKLSYYIRSKLDRYPTEQQLEEFSKKFDNKFSKDVLLELYRTIKPLNSINFSILPDEPKDELTEQPNKQPPKKVNVKQILGLPDDPKPEDTSKDKTKSEAKKEQKQKARERFNIKDTPYMHLNEELEDDSTEVPKQDQKTAEKPVEKSKETPKDDPKTAPAQSEKSAEKPAPTGQAAPGSSTAVGKPPTKEQPPMNASTPAKPAEKHMETPAEKPKDEEKPDDPSKGKKNMGFAD